MVVDVLTSLSAVTIESTASGKLRIERQNPANIADFDFDEVSLRRMPDELRRVLTWSNGFQFFGVVILSTEELYCTEDNEVVFHDWGTGDVTALRPSDGAAVFRGHGKCDGLVVAPSLEEWFKRVYEEIRHHGVLIHPEDSERMRIATMYNPDV